MIYKIVRYMEECKKTSQDQGQSMQKEKVLKQFQFTNTCIYNEGNTNFVKYSSPFKSHRKYKCQINMHKVWFGNQLDQDLSMYSNLHMKKRNWFKIRNPPTHLYFQSMLIQR